MFLLVTPDSLIPIILLFPVLTHWEDLNLASVAWYKNGGRDSTHQISMHSKQFPALHPSIMLLILPKGLGAVETHVISGIMLLKAGVSLHASPPL